MSASGAGGGGPALALAPGAEVDFCVRDDAWVPARVEAGGAAGALRVRFALGALDVVRDVAAAELVARVAPAGALSLPLLCGQVVDALMRTPATAAFAASEQWQRGACWRARSSHCARACGRSGTERVRGPR